MMNMTEFISSIEKGSQPINKWSMAIQALWWAKKGNWKKAHDLAQDAGTIEGDWVHAYLHREEGDLQNASYWYDRAGKAVCQTNLSTEWKQMANELICR